MRKIITFTHFLQGACWQHLSNNAVEETTARKEALKAEVTDAIAELTATIASDKDLLAKAPKGKEGKPAVEKAKAMCKWLISWSGKRDSNLLGIIL